MEEYTLAQCLHKYSMESLHAYCEEYDAEFTEDDKDAVCIALSNALIQQNAIAQRLGILEDNAFDALQGLIRGSSIDDENLIDALDGLDLIYGSAEDGQWHAAQETAEAVNAMDETMDQKRKDRVWLMQCLTIVQHYWADASMAVMRELYQKNPSVDPDADLKELFAEIPNSETPCTMIQDSFVIRGWRSSEVFAGYRQSQQNCDFYIPSMEEVLDLYHNDFDTLDPCGMQVKEWFLHAGADEADLELLLHEMWNDMNYGHTEQSIRQNAESMITYDTAEEQNDFRQKVHAWYLHARRIDMRGHRMAEREQTE
ncbi:MAG: hypothetical protein GX478_05360 [Erysipelotrichaceae bacterium]|nr:hypothetical protein [Erysipelotrichaceae bacterium]